jgi:hypothetical protein
MLRGLRDDLQLLALGRILDLLEKRPAHSRNCIHRCSEFVAHVGQERALGKACSFGDIARLSELSGALSDQLFEVVAMILQLLMR